jgi:hypothetical protein
MKAICINNRNCENYLTLGSIYDVEIEKPDEYYRVMNLPKSLQAPWKAMRFRIIGGDLPPGQIYCQCGTITTNVDCCCECKVK